MVSARHLPFILSPWLCPFKENSPHTALHLRAKAYPRQARVSLIMGYKKRNRLGIAKQTQGVSANHFHGMVIHYHIAHYSNHKKG